MEHLKSSIRITSLAELELLLLTVCTGMQDATTFPDYHCFASNQTGNTVLLAVSFTTSGLAGELFITNNIGLCLGMFLAGGYITGQISHHFVNARGRPWLLFCNAIQTALVFGAAAIQFVHGVKADNVWALAALACLAFASGSQVVLSRVFSMTEISTAMATAAWVDLMVDANNLRLRNKPRDRRVLFLIALLIGSFVGAGLYRTVGSAWAILASGIGKLIVLVMFLFNECERKESDALPDMDRVP